MDLFDSAGGNVVVKPQQSYTAKDIEVLEGLEPVRLRPGMYIGGTDEKALYHLISEVLDNSMDEAVAGFASQINIHLSKNDEITIEDNGRGIPVDPHPKFPDKSALEVILTTLHSGGKFNNKVYSTSGGLHGVGVSVVNALTDKLLIKVHRNKKLYSQSYSKGTPLTKLLSEDIASLKTGTSVTFHPDPEIFPKITYKADKVYRIACSKAYLFKGVTINWSCDPELVEGEETPERAKIHFPNGLKDYLIQSVNADQILVQDPFFGEAEFPAGQGKVEWAVNWLLYGEQISRSYCNTINTPLGGTHEMGLRSAILKGLKNFAEMSGNKKVGNITAEDVTSSGISLISVFIKNPTFQGQTKEKLLTQDTAKLVENAIRHQFEHWLAANPKLADLILEQVINEAEERLKRKKSKEVTRKNPIKSLRLPGKLADCSQDSAKGTEIFLVEGDSAGGSAKQARNRETQAILPLKGKILNVASNSVEKMRANQEISDLVQALGSGMGNAYKESDLRYERVVIMTDADVDGAHITSLLLTFFYMQMPELIHNGHLYLAQPPLYKVTQGSTNYYVKDDAEKDKLMAKLSKSKGNIELGRFKGLGEMAPAQLKETTMDPSKRTLLKVQISEENKASSEQLVEDLMGKNPELRFKFIKERTESNIEDLEKYIDV